MARPSYEELDSMYRATLRQLVQAKHRADTLEVRLLAEASRHRQAAQAIDLSIEEVKRQDEHQDTARMMERVAYDSKPAVTLPECRPTRTR